MPLSSRVQHRRRQLLVRRPRSRVERGLRWRGSPMRRRTSGSAMESSGIGSWWPMRLAASIATAVPSAFGGWEAIVEVCGSTTGLLPQTLCHPPEGRVFRARREGQRRIMIRVHARQARKAFGHEAAAAAYGAGTPWSVWRVARDHRDCAPWPLEPMCRRPCYSARAARAIRSGGARSIAIRTVREAFASSARCRRDGFARRRFHPGAVPGLHELAEVDVADLSAVEGPSAGRRIGFGMVANMVISLFCLPQSVRNLLPDRWKQVFRLRLGMTGLSESVDQRLRFGIGAGMGRNRAWPLDPRQAMRSTRGIRVGRDAAVRGDAGIGVQRDVGDAVIAAASNQSCADDCFPSPPARRGRDSRS